MATVRVGRIFVPVCAAVSSALLVLQIAGCGGDDAAAPPVDGSADQTSDRGVTGSDSPGVVDVATEAKQDTTTGEAGDAGAGDGDATLADVQGDTADASDVGDAADANDASDALDSGANDSGSDAKDSGDASSDADAAPPTCLNLDGGAITVGNFEQVVADTACTTIRDCCGLAEANFARTTCTSDFISVAGFELTGYPLGYLSGGRVAYDPASACMCLQAIRALGPQPPTNRCGIVSTATYTAMQATCFAALPGTAVASTDGGCASSFECAEGLYCKGSRDAGAGTCAPLEVDGGDCSQSYRLPENNGACAYRGVPGPELYCNVVPADAGTDAAGTSTCTPRLADDAPCAHGGLLYSCQANRCNFTTRTCGPDVLYWDRQDCTTYYYVASDAGHD